METYIRAYYSVELKNLVGDISEIFDTLGIDSTDKYVIYERNQNKESVLGIQLVGHKEDNNNFMFFGAQPHKFGTEVSCDVYLHADSKVAKQTTQVTRYIQKPVVDYFNRIEEFLDDRNRTDYETKIELPISERKKELPKLKLLDRFRQITKKGLQK